MLEPNYQQLEALGLPPPGPGDLVRILLGTDTYTADPYIYKLASNGCFAITNLRQTIYNSPYHYKNIFLIMCTQTS